MHIPETHCPLSLAGLLESSQAILEVEEQIPSLLLMHVPVWQKGVCSQDVGGLLLPSAHNVESADSAWQ